MHYTGPVIRPPYEAGSVMLEVTVGCTHDSCTFCTYYKGHPFHPAPLEQVRADLAEIARSAVADCNRPVGGKQQRRHGSAHNIRPSYDHALTPRDRNIIAA